MDAYLSLAEAVILQAVKDYRTALRNPQKKQQQIKEIEDFFLSDWFDLLSSGINPKELMRRIKLLPQSISRSGKFIQPRLQLVRRAGKPESFRKTNK